MDYPLIILILSLIALSVGLYVDRVRWEVKKQKEREKKAYAEMLALINRRGRQK